jgi:hypothetical protein
VPPRISDSKIGSDSRTPRRRQVVQRKQEDAVEKASRRAAVTVPNVSRSVAAWPEEQAPLRRESRSSISARFAWMPSGPMVAGANHFHRRRPTEERLLVVALLLERERQGDWHRPQGHTFCAFRTESAYAKLLGPSEILRRCIELQLGSSRGDLSESSPYAAITATAARAAPRLAGSPRSRRTGDPARECGASSRPPGRGLNARCACSKARGRQPEAVLDRAIASNRSARVALGRSSSPALARTSSARSPPREIRVARGIPG